MNRYARAKLGEYYQHKIGSKIDLAKRYANPKNIFIDMGGHMEAQIKSNPFVRNILSAQKESKAYQDAFQKLQDKNLPQMEGYRSLIQATGIRDPLQMIDDLKNRPQEVIEKVKKQPKEKMQKIKDAFESDINEAPLSSSWLAYGTFIPSRTNPDKGEIHLTTKDNLKFKTPPQPRTLWDKMRKKIGITVYKNGKRSGASYGAGTILHKYVPQRLWRKEPNKD